MNALPARIASKINFGVEGDCWTWAASHNPAGYGLVRFDGKTCRAHRVVYTLLIGPIPVGLELDHRCRNHACVNPSHLEPVTGSENVLRGLKGYALRTLCRSGRHDITDPENIYVKPSTGNRKCLTCQRESARLATRRYRAGRALLSRDGVTE